MTQTRKYTRTEEGYYVCPEKGCGAVKRLPSTLSMHMKTHAGVKEHVCSEPGCDASFIHKSGLTQHMTQKHGTGDLLTCTFCDHSCKMKANMLIHVGRKHCASYVPAFNGVCSGCTKPFSSEGGYYYHALQCFAAPTDVAEKLGALTV